MPPERWSKQSIISLSYGYEITSALLQIARAFCIFANDGHLIVPRLIKDKETLNPKSLFYSINQPYAYYFRRNYFITRNRQKQQYMATQH